MEKFSKTGGTKYFYQNKLDKACFQHDMAYGTYEDLFERIHSEKLLHGKAFAIANNRQYDGYHH